MDEARVFTVRVWRHAQQFRAAVRAVGDERASLFTEPALMTEFLLQASAADTAEPVPPLPPLSPLPPAPAGA